LIAFVISHQLNIIGCHTNFDQILGGVSDLLAQELGVVGGEPLLRKKCDTPCGFGWIGDLAKFVEGAAFVEMVAKTLAQPNLMVAGPVPDVIRRVAVCGGSCGDFAGAAQKQGADVFITSEIKHSQARWAEDAGMCLLDAGHFSTENKTLIGLLNYMVESMGLANVQLSQTQDRPLRGYLELQK
jgi:putative NIF3 family GTP cyclohydrolase 1 type 2